MDANNNIRTPKQSRSINTKEKIIDAALELLCSKGYYNTTTNEIAKAADVSIGSLYSYFKDKNSVFMEILERYNERLMKALNNFPMNDELYKTDKRKWLYEYMKNLIDAHRSSKDFTKELNLLYYSMPEVAAVLDKQREKVQERTLKFLYMYKDDINVKDYESSSIVLYTFIESIVHKIAFDENETDGEKLLNTAVEMLCSSLLK